jgi:SH3 domain protein
MKAGIGLLAGLVLLLALSPAAAETLYITDQIRAGLHEDKRPDSPIIKVIPTGTAVEVIKREDDVSFVREAGGASGWIDNSYLAAQEPSGAAAREARARAQTLQQQLGEAKNRIQSLQAQVQAQPDSDTVQKLRETNADLQQQLTELRKQAGGNTDSKSLYQKIADLAEQNKALEAQLAGVRDNPAAGEGGATGAASGLPWHRLLLYAGIALVLGLGLGIYIMDTANRRRHGGFRV